MFANALSNGQWLATYPWESDKVSVGGLKLVLNAGFDAWGRKKTQPVEISATLSLRQHFTSAASTDSVDASTVHYGHMAKSIISTAESSSGPDETGWLSSNDLAQALAAAAIRAAADESIVSTAEVEIAYPKASHFGEGIVLTLKQNVRDDSHLATLCLRRIHIPALVGVNSHETLMKQAVIISVWVDRVRRHISDCSHELEQLIVKTVDEAEYATLEYMAEEVAARIVKYFIMAKSQNTTSFLEPAGVRVRIEKPSAVPLADAPSIDIYRSANVEEAFGRRMATELGSKRPQIPFPLTGRLDEFLKSWKQD